LEDIVLKFGKKLLNIKGADDRIKDDNKNKIKYL
jgi:hypothetical protein